MEGARNSLSNAPSSAPFYPHNSCSHSPRNISLHFDVCSLPWRPFTLPHSRAPLEASFTLQHLSPPQLFLATLCNAFPPCSAFYVRICVHVRVYIDIYMYIHDRIRPAATCMRQVPGRRLGWRTRYRRATGKGEGIHRRSFKGSSSHPLQIPSRRWSPKRPL